MESPVYFLQKKFQGYYVVYARGISVLNIPDLYNFRIVKMYPSPIRDLTPRIVILQRKWRTWKKFRQWCAHPYRLHYREIHGQFPPQYTDRRRRVDCRRTGGGTGSSAYKIGGCAAAAPVAFAPVAAGGCSM